MEPFIVNTDITDINDLYGRAKSIKILQSCASRKENAGIIGARRFGKTLTMSMVEQFFSVEYSGRSDKITGYNS